jgi:hypothetical protein
VSAHEGHRNASDAGAKQSRSRRRRYPCALLRSDKGGHQIRAEDVARIGAEKQCRERRRRQQQWASRSSARTLDRSPPGSHNRSAKRQTSPHAGGCCNAAQTVVSRRPGPPAPRAWKRPRPGGRRRCRSWRSDVTPASGPPHRMATLKIEAPPSLRREGPPNSGDTRSRGWICPEPEVSRARQARLEAAARAWEEKWGIWPRCCRSSGCGDMRTLSVVQHGWARAVGRLTSR